MPHVGEPFSECEIEITPYVCELTGTLRAEVWEVGGEHPTGIIRDNQDWYVKVNFGLEGLLLHHLCGKLCFVLHIECIGSGPEKTLVKRYVDLEPCGDGTYQVDLPVPAGEIGGADCGQVCCLVVTVTSLDPCGDPGHIAAYCKGPCIMFAEATHP
jgi:hypothetical protein